MRRKHLCPASYTPNATMNPCFAQITLLFCRSLYPEFSRDSKEFEAIRRIFASSESLAIVMPRA